MQNHYNSIQQEKKKYENEESERRAQIKQNDTDIRNQIEDRVSVLNYILHNLFIIRLSCEMKLTQLKSNITSLTSVPKRPSMIKWQS